MKNYFSLCLILLIKTSQAQDAVNPVFLELKNKAENCFRVKDYACCIENYRKSLIIAPSCEDCKLKMLTCKNAMPTPTPLKKYPIGNGFFSFQKSGKWGLIDAQNKIVLQPIYNEIEKFDECLGGSLCKVYDGKKLNFLLPNGSWIAEPNVFTFKPNFPFSSDWDCYKSIGIFKKGNNYGLISRKGDVVLNFVYENIEEGDIDGYILTQHRKMGIASSEGKVVLEPKYDKILGFIMRDSGHTWSSKYSVVKNTNKFGIINNSGDILINCEYDSIQVNFSEDQIRAMKNNKWGIIDINNKITTPFKYDDINRMSLHDNGILVVKKDSKYGIIDRYRYITDLKFERIETRVSNCGNCFGINKGYFVGQIDGRKSLFYYNELLFEVKDNAYLYKVSQENNNYIMFALILGDNFENKVYGIYNDKTKKIILPLIYKDIQKNPDYLEDKSNTFWVSNSEASALYDLDSERFLTEFIYEKPYLGNNLESYKFLPVKLIGKNREVLINRKGEIIDNNYEHLTNFHKKLGIYGFKKGNKWGFIDDSFKEIIPPTYDTMNWNDNDTKIYVSHNKKSFVINKQGKCIENCK